MVTQVLDYHLTAVLIKEVGCINGPSIAFQRLIEGIQDNEKIRILRDGLTPKQAALLDAQLQRIMDIDWEKSTDAEAAKVINDGKALLRALEK